MAKLYSCVETLRDLCFYIDNELPLDEMVAIEAHLSGCVACFKEYQAMKQLVNLLSTLPELEPPAIIAANLKNIYMEGGMEPMECQKFEELFSRYLDGELKPAESELLREHLAQCAHCRTELQSMEGANKLIETLPEVEPPAHLHAAIIERMGREEQPITTRIWRQLRWLPRQRWVAVPVVGLAVAAAGLMIFFGVFKGRVETPIAKAPGVKIEKVAPKVSIAEVVKKPAKKVEAQLAEVAWKAVSAPAKREFVLPKPKGAVVEMVKLAEEIMLKAKPSPVEEETVREMAGLPEQPISGPALPKMDLGRAASEAEAKRDSGSAAAEEGANKISVFRAKKAVDRYKYFGVAVEPTRMVSKLEVAQAALEEATEGPPPMAEVRLLGVKF